MHFLSCVLLCFLISHCFGQLSVERKEKFVNGFLEYLNNLPNQIYTYDEGYIVNAQKTEDANSYNVEALLLSKTFDDLETLKYQKCFATILDLQFGISVLNNKHHCEDSDSLPQTNQNEYTNPDGVGLDDNTTPKSMVTHEPVQLDNEVQINTGVTSGEQFIAVPRKKTGLCVGCSSHVNPQAPGVEELAVLGIKHLDLHEQNVKHSLKAVKDVQRQIQVVNGVRYILTLEVGYDPCATTSEGCFESKICKISILEKSWKKLPDGSRYRAILSNNCTQEWIFGDEGEVITNGNVNTEANLAINPQPTPDYDKNENNGSVDDILKAVHNVDVQVQPNQDKIITIKEIKQIEEQIVPHDHFEETTKGGDKPTESSDINVHHINPTQTKKYDTDTSVPFRQPQYQENDFLSEDKKKAIDDLINFFDSVGLENNVEKFSRLRRSYSHDLKVMALTEKIHKIKKNIQNAKYVYNLAQNVVNYLNEMDFVVKTRVLQEVITAEEEMENHQHFFYLQARVVIPCDKADCGSSEGEIKICNGVLEIIDNDVPQILSAFCYDDKKKKLVPKIETVSSNDPLLLKLTKEALKKIEKESSHSNAMTIEKIIHASTQKSFGTRTKIIISLAYTNCNKTIPYVKRANCTIIQNMDSSICDVTIYERHWLKEKTITYSCTQRPFDERFSIKKQILTEPEILEDPKIVEMVQEALQYLEIKSNRHNKQKIVEIKSVSTQLVGGLVTKVNFMVGYTECSNGIEVDPNSCKLLEHEALRKCNAEVWDRPWLEDGRQINVTCDDSLDEPPTVSRKKRSKNYALVGGQTNKDPEDNKYKKLAQESLKQYLEKNDVGEIYEVLKVDKVSVQVVAGTSTTIDFRILKSNLGSQNNDNKEIHCHSKIWEKPWMNFKEITITCDDLIDKVRTKRSLFGMKTDGNEKKLNVSSKSNDIKTRTKKQIPGGEREENPNDKRFYDMANLSLKKFIQNTGTSQHHTIISIKTVKTQVVAGYLTKIDFIISPTNCVLDSHLEATSSNCVILDSTNQISCHSTVWDRPWLNDTEININCDKNPDDTQSQIEENKLHLMRSEVVNDPKIYEYDVDEMKSYAEKESASENKSTLRSKRAATRGSFVKRNPNNMEYKKLAEESLRKYLRDNNIKNKHQITTMNRVMTKVVSGMIYKIKFIASPICPSDIRFKSVKCKDNKTNTLFCDTEIWNRPWKNSKKIDIECNKENSEENDSESRKKRDLYGAPKQQSVIKYKSLVEEAVNKYQKQSNSKYLHKLIEIHNVTKQVVAGMLTKLEFSISPTKCFIGDAAIGDCELQSPEIKLRCSANVWVRPWIKDSKDITVTCDNPLQIKDLHSYKTDLKERKKRQMTPEEDYVDEDTKYYYADRAVQHINDHSHSNNLQKLITIHAFHSSTNMGVSMIRMYIEVGYTYCLRHEDEANLNQCDELSGMYHRLCHVRLWPSPDDELVVQSLVVVCDDDKEFRSVTGISITNLIKASIKELETSPNIKSKLVHQGDPYIVPSLDSQTPTKLSFIIRATNCSKFIDVEKNRFLCYIDSSRLPKSCTSQVWMTPNSKKIKKVTVNCAKPYEYRSKRSLAEDTKNTTSDEITINKLVKESLEKLEMSSIHKYKQRLLQINSFSSQITTGRLTTIDFDVGYTKCLKYEWVEDISDCEFIEHLSSRHCISHVFERLWIDNGKEITVTCEDDESSVKTQNENANSDSRMAMAEESLKHIEAKYPHPRKQKVVRIFSLEKQQVAGIHFRLKLEVGFTDCPALTMREDCKLVNDMGVNKFCRVNVWLRPWTEHPPLYRVTCDYQDATSRDLYLKIQAERLFSGFITTYKPDYVNNQTEMIKRFNIFQDNVQKIHELNVHERGTATYGVTRFTDMSYEEFSSQYTGLKPSLRVQNDIPMRKADIPELPLPQEFDWRQLDAVTEVKNQGSCGSCWAFSVTGNIEGQFKVQTGQLLSLSEQELVDCDKLDDGCNGGLPDNAYRAIEQLGGLEMEKDYPYEGENDQCAFNKTLSKVQISGAVNISSNETDMAKWLTQNGPISIGINANAMQFYMGGISHPWKMLCSPSNLDHGVLIVGYGIKNYPLFHKLLPFWIVKNSWGKSWGEQGYYRVYRGDGTCGVNQMASSAVL